MLDTLKARKRRRMVSDLIALSVIFVFFFVLFSAFDVLEQVLNIAHRYEQYELDEFISASVILSFLFAIFAYRRWQDVREFSLFCEELSMIDPITMLPNRRVISRLLKDISTGNSKQSCFPLSLILLDIQGLHIIQSRFGHSVAEQAIHELVYRYSLLLNDDQLISYRTTNQCLVFCPLMAETAASALAKQLCAVKLTSHATIQSLLTVDSATLTLTKISEIDGVFEHLEDLLASRPGAKNLP